MENLASPELVISIIGGGVVALLTQLLKGPLKRFSSRMVVALIALLSGVAYFAFYTYVPELLKQEIIDFVYGTLSSAVFIYAFIWKGLTGEDVKKTKK